MHGLRVTSPTQSTTEAELLAMVLMFSMQGACRRSACTFRRPHTTWLQLPSVMTCSTHMCCPKAEVAGYATAISALPFNELIAMLLTTQASFLRATASTKQLLSVICTHRISSLLWLTCSVIDQQTQAHTDAWALLCAPFAQVESRAKLLQVNVCDTTCSFRV